MLFKGIPIPYTVLIGDSALFKCISIPYAVLIGDSMLLKGIPIPRTAFKGEFNTTNLCRQIPTTQAWLGIPYGWRRPAWLPGGRTGSGWWRGASSGHSPPPRHPPHTPLAWKKKKKVESFA